MPSREVFIPTSSVMPTLASFELSYGKILLALTLEDNHLATGLQIVFHSTSPNLDAVKVASRYFDPDNQTLIEPDDLTLSNSAHPDLPIIQYWKLGWPEPLALKAIEIEISYKGQHVLQLDIIGLDLQLQGAHRKQDF